MKRREFLQANVAAGFAWSFGKWPPFGSAPAQATLLIAGATAVLPYSKPLGETFAKATGIEVTIDGGGTLAGLIALKRGAIDIAATDRDLERSENDGTLLPYMLGKDAIAMLVGKTSPVRGLTRAQTIGILSGHITNWAAVGAPAGAIEVLHHTPNSPTRKFVESEMLAHGEVTRRATIALTSEEIDQRLNANPRAIGYLAIKDIQPDSVTVPIDGVPITRASIYSDRYPFTRSMYYVTTDKPSAAATRFIAFMKSNAGQTLIEPELMRVY